MNEFELVTLKSGIKSLRALNNLETFHPVTGPEVEAKILYVEQQKLLERANQAKSSFIIWDIGLGAAANALAAIETLLLSTGEIEIHSFDFSTKPLEFAIQNSNELKYLDARIDDLKKLIAEKYVCLKTVHGKSIHWYLHLEDFSELIKTEDKIPAPDSIFYDPYSPKSNPEMWSLEHFENLFRRLENRKSFLLTNYTRSTAVRVTFLLAGFFVGRGVSVGEKAETTVVSNDFSFLDRPLESKWFEVLKSSGNSAPLSNKVTSQAAISDSDFERLKNSNHFLFSTFRIKKSAQ